MIIAFLRSFLLFFNSSLIAGIAGVAKNAKKTTPYGMKKLLILKLVRLFVFRLGIVKIAKMIIIMKIKRTIETSLFSTILIPS